MRIFLVIALVLLIFALIVATGTALITGWNVWLCAGLVSWLIDQVFGGYIGTYTRRTQNPPTA